MTELTVRIPHNKTYELPDGKRAHFPVDNYGRTEITEELVDTLMKLAGAHEIEETNA